MAAMSKSVWVVCGGMRRGGSTLQYHLVSSLVEVAGGVVLGLTSPESFPNQFEHHSDKDGYLVVKCHRFVPELGQLVPTGQAKAVYIFRDIRDVCVSLQHKNDDSFLDMIRQGFPEDVLSEYHYWTGLPEAYVSKYETVMADMHDEVKSLAAYLGVSVSDGEIIAIAEQHSFSKQKENIARFNYESDGLGEGHNRYDPNSLLHPNHLRSGKSEQWKSDLTRLQVAYVEYCGYSFFVEEGYRISQPWLIRQYARIFFWFVIRFTIAREYYQKGILLEKVIGKLNGLVRFSDGGGN